MDSDPRFTIVPFIMLVGKSKSGSAHGEGNMFRGAHHPFYVQLGPE